MALSAKVRTADLMAATQSFVAAVMEVSTRLKPKRSSILFVVSVKPSVKQTISSCVAIWISWGCGDTHS